jgi:diguanylate cyclase (GGDEF)-like protein/PAS domain S-box-containing protein
MINENIKTSSIKNSQPKIHVLVVEDPHSRQTIILDKANYSLGRDPRNSIVILSKKASRFHATLLRRTDSKKNTFSYWILDGDLQGNKSTNGIFINQQRALVQELKHEDVIQIGGEIEAYYYVISHLSDLSLLPSGDFDNKKTSPLEQTAEKTNLYGETIYISENNLEAEKMKLDGETVYIPEADLEAEKMKLDGETVYIPEADLEAEKIPSPPLSKLASFPELSPNPIIEIDWEGNITYLNPAANHKFKDILESPSNHPLLAGLVETTKNYGNNNNLFVREIKVGQQVFEQYIHYISAKKLIRSYVFDFTKRKQIELQLKESEQRYKAVISQIQAGIFLVDVGQKKVLEANNAFGDLLGYSLGQIYDLTLDEIINLDFLTLEQELNNLLNTKNKVIKNFSFYRQDKSLIELQTSIFVTTYKGQNALCFSLLPEKIVKSPETLIQEQGLHDLITGLPNRNLFIEQATIAIANNQRKQELLSIIFLELNELQDFKQAFNDNIQSNLLGDFVKRLRSCLRSGDTIARWEDNQFVILLPELRSIKDLGKIRTRILDAIKPPFFIEQQNIYMKTNMGISLYGEDGDNVKTLLNNAKNALNKSKQKGNNHAHFYNETVQNEIERLLRLEKLLIQALDKDEFLLYYQPQVNFKTKTITGLETLLRWQHPELGLIAPEQFLSLAEETGLIIPIGEWVLEKSCQQNKIWQQSGLNFSPITVNISSEQFQQPNLVSFLKNILSETELEPYCLELEISEKTIMQQMELATQKIPELNKIGVRICLDDFGSGFSSVGYLKNFKFHSLKMSQSLIKNLENNSQDLAIISALIKLGQSFQLRVIAEGVETKEQLDLLSSLDCQEIQGHLFCEALAMEDLTNFLGNPVYNF